MSLYLDGTDDYILIPSEASDDLDIVNNITLMCWIKEDGDQTNYARIFSRENVGAGNRQFSIGYDASQQVRALVDTAGVNSVIVSHGVLNNDWHHLAMTYEAPTLEFFVDAVSAGTDDGSGNLPSEDVDIVIGNVSHLGSSLYFKGSVAEISIWNVVLTQAQIQSYMYKGLGALAGIAGLVGYWPINDANSGVEVEIQNLVGNGYDGEMNEFADNPWRGSPPVSLQNRRA